MATYLISTHIGQCDKGDVVTSFSPLTCDTCNGYIFTFK